jgi:hypothetical protein
MHHGVSANALEGKELVLGKRNLINCLIPRHDQRRIQKESLPQLDERGILLPSLFIVRKAMAEARLGRLLRRRASRQVNGDGQ